MPQLHVWFDARMGSRPPGPQSRRSLLVAFAAIGLIVVAAAATPDGWALFTTKRPDEVLTPDFPKLFFYLLLFIALAAVTITVSMRVVAIRQGIVVRDKRSTVIILVVVVVSWILAPKVAEFLDSFFDNDETIQQSAEDESPPDAEDEITTERSRGLGQALTLLLLLFTIGITAGAVWLFMPEKAEIGLEDPGGELLGEVERSLEDVRAITDPRAAVIACYARLEAVSAVVGVRRRTSDAPFEHLARLLERFDIPDTSARKLTELFERAKFSNTSIDETARGEAIQALEEVRAQLGAGV
jgi:hypothetical protein